MSRKNKAYRAFLHQNPSPTIEHAWDAAWANRQACFQSKRMQEQDDKITQLQAKNAALREAQRRIRELEAELSTLRESAKPFAKYAQEMMRCNGRSGRVYVRYQRLTNIGGGIPDQPETITVNATINGMTYPLTITSGQTLEVQP